MNEIDLIKKYLEQACHQTVNDVCYYNENGNTAVDINVDIGLIKGFSPGNLFFFGNINYFVELSGTINPALNNSVTIYHRIIFSGVSDPGYNRFDFAIGYNLGILGDGHYKGHKNIYGSGFSRIEIHQPSDAGVVMALKWNVNGYLFNVFKNN